MQEADIMWEGENLWVGKTGREEFTVFKIADTHSVGFLTLRDCEAAIVNAMALDSRMDIVGKLIK
jgi:hypothetical protein